MTSQNLSQASADFTYRLVDLRQGVLWNMSFNINVLQFVKGSRYESQSGKTPMNHCMSRILAKTVFVFFFSA